MPTKRDSTGFTLIELMIAVAIVAVLTAVALPSYQAYVRKTARSAAQSFMLTVAGKEEQVMLDQRSYVAVSSANFANAPSAGGLNLAVPSETNGRYTFSVFTTVATCPAPVLAPPSPPMYCVIATAIGSQTVDGNLGLDNLGTKAPVAKWQ